MYKKLTLAQYYVQYDDSPTRHYPFLSNTAHVITSAVCIPKICQPDLRGSLQPGVPSEGFFHHRNRADHAVKPKRDGKVEPRGTP